MALNWKSGTLLVSGIGGTVFGVRHLFTKEQSIAPPALGEKILAEETQNSSTEDFKVPEDTEDSETLKQKELEQQLQLARGLTEQEREQKRQKAKELIKKLDDYTFKLFSNCNYGTGWILDYQLPKEKGKYPLIWYIATNAHVTVPYGFRENPYEQEIAIDYQAMNRTYMKHRRWSFSDFSLDRDANCKYRDQYGWFDFNIAKQSDGQAIKSDESAVSLGKIRAPRLFYSSIDFLKNPSETGVKDGYTPFKDFAVLEIEFTDEDYARRATRNFAGKYPLDSTNAINIFGRSLDDRLDLDNIDGNEEDFFSLGYPLIEGKPFEQKVTWDDNTLQGERLSNDMWNWYTNPWEHKKIKGFMDAKRFTLEYGKKNLQYFGHMYLTKGFLLKGGSSGAMYVDFDGNLIGLKSRGEDGAYEMHSFVEPIRSKRIKKESLNTPEYDLILGAKGQKSSYKSQVKKYITAKGNKTWLSERGWRHITQVP